MNYLAQDSARANRILGALNMADYLRLSPQLEAVQLQAGQVLEAPGHNGTHVHFPISCAATLVSATRDGDMSELALIGREGLIGLLALLGNAPVSMQAVVLRPGLAYRLPAPVFAAAMHSSAPLQALCLRHVQNLMLQMAQGVLCSMHHSVLQRLSSWLLYHCTVTGNDQVCATHETIAHMLGVRRESITQAAGQLQSSGCLSTSRGRITINDPQAMRAQVCECFSLLANDHQQLWESPLPQAQAGPVVGAFALAERALLPEPQMASAPERMTDGDGACGARYADIYDFAPVGLLSVDSQGRLVESNLAAAILLGISRSQCLQYRFVDFLQDDARSTFDAFHREVLSGRCRRHCDLALKAAAHRGPAMVRLEATVDESGEENRMVMIDVTDTYERLRQLQEHSAERTITMPEGRSWRLGAGSARPGSATAQGTRVFAG